MYHHDRIRNSSSLALIVVLSSTIIAPVTAWNLLPQKAVFQYMSDSSRQLSFRSTFESSVVTSTTALGMVLDAGMELRLDGISRSYQALTERLGDPDVIGDSNLLRKVMSDRSQSEEVVLAYEEVRKC
jgi:hypothetical protein